MPPKGAPLHAKVLDTEARLFDVEPYYGPASGDIALTDPDGGECLAVMKVTEKHAIDKAHKGDRRADREVLHAEMAGSRPRTKSMMWWTGAFSISNLPVDASKRDSVKQCQF